MDAESTIVTDDGKARDLRLNLGAGTIDQWLPGYDNNIDDLYGGRVYPDLRTNEGAFIGDGSCAEIRASHILEHFGHGETLDVLKEWVRALRPGGVLKVAVPDFDYIVKAYTEGIKTPHPFEAYLMGGQTMPSDRHGAIFNAAKLTELLRLAGLTNIRRWKSEIADCAAYDVSLNLQGEKPIPRTGKPLEGVHVVMTAPRLSFTDQSTCLLSAIGKMGIPVRVGQGVFWDACLTRLFEACIEDGAKYIITVDYDSLFRPEHVMQLHDLMERNPEADAIAPIQMGRDRDSTLMTIRQQDGKNASAIRRDVFDADLTPVNTCHFGLTIIRAASLAKMPRPWFKASPDGEGRWGDGRIDSDIHFWRQAEAAGMKVYQANRVVIGHMQLMATWPDQNLEPIHQYLGQYRENGAPAEVWT